MKYTIEDVAREAGVSITTVSRVLNGNYPVKKETKEKVNRVIEKLNYQPNPLARGLINKKTESIGVVVPSITNMFFTEVVQGIEKEAKAKGYDVFLASTDGDAETEKSCVGKFIDKLVDGIIVVDPQTENMIDAFYRERLLKIPIIFVNGYHENINTNFVLSSEENGIRDAIEYLYRLGHRKIAFFRGGKSYSYDIKETIYKEYMSKINSSEIILSTCEGNSIDVVENAKGTIINLNNGNCLIGRDITAFVACNDLMAAGIMNGCKALDIEVPDTVSIIGFDNIILSQMTTPKITTVDQNMRILGVKSAGKLIGLIDSKNLECENEIVDTILIERESCKKTEKK
jgi:LacI family transcriptional regulator